MVYHKNDQPDIISVENWYKNQYKQHFTNFTNITSEENKEYFQNVLHFAQSYNEQERYFTNPPTNRDSKNTDTGSNCASLVASILRYCGATWERIRQAADTDGIDAGDQRLIPANRFNP